MENKTIEEVEVTNVEDTNVDTCDNSIADIENIDTNETVEKKDRTLREVIRDERNALKLLAKKESQLDKLTLKFEKLDKKTQEDLLKYKSTIQKLREEIIELKEKSNGRTEKLRSKKNEIDEKNSTLKEKYVTKIDMLIERISILRERIKVLEESQVQTLNTVNVSVQIFDRNQIVKVLTLGEVSKQINEDTKKIKFCLKDNVKYRDVFGNLEKPEDALIGRNYIFNPMSDEIQNLVFPGSPISSQFINTTISTIHTEHPNIGREEFLGMIENQFKAKLVSEKGIRIAGITKENAYDTKITYVTFNKKIKRFVFVTIYN